MLLSSKRIMATLTLLAQIELHVIIVYIASTFVTAANYNSNYVGRDNFLASANAVLQQSTPAAPRG
jgi:hypothetical protein